MWFESSINVENLYVIHELLTNNVNFYNGIMYKAFRKFDVSQYFVFQVGL